MPPDQHKSPKPPNVGWTPAEKAQGSRQESPGEDTGTPAGAAEPAAKPSSDREATEQAAATIEQDSADHNQSGSPPRKP